LKQSFKPIFLWIFLIVAIVVMYQALKTAASGDKITFSEFIEKALPDESNHKIAFSEFIDQALPEGSTSSEVSKVSVYDGDVIAGKFRNGGSFTTVGNIDDYTRELILRRVEIDYSPTGKSPLRSDVRKLVITGKEIEGELVDGTRFKTNGRIDDYQKALIQRGVGLDYTPEDQNSFWISILGTWLPMIFLFLIFFFFMRQLQSGGGKAMSFGKSRHKILSDSHKKVTFADIAGIDEAKEELQ